MSAVPAPSLVPVAPARVRPVEPRRRCPLCGAERAAPSWLGSTRYGGDTYTYLQCGECRSLYCDPMPAGKVLGQMYGPDYQHVLAGNHEGSDRELDSEIDRVLRLLNSMRQASGTFVDYGCGRGELVRAAARIGWRAVGVEFDAGVAALVAQRTGATVVARDEARRLLRGSVDVLHLGDVIEHLTAVEEEMATILGLMRPGGLLIARGPLEANANLFTLVLRAARTAAGAPTSTMPPYHVLLATADGQRRFFERFGLAVERFEVSEVAWPAPARLHGRDIVRPRAVGLFALRLVSRVVSALGPRHWGNRYFCTAVCGSPPVEGV